MAKIPILSGVVADEAANFRTRYPRNMTPTPVEQSISKGYLRPGDGIKAFATGPGNDRGGINWRGKTYRVSGTKLIRVNHNGTVDELGDVGDGGYCTLDYSFDRLAIASGGRMYLYDDGIGLVRVTDPDLGPVIDLVWVAGRFMTTDGTFIVQPELTDPTSVDPLKYGSAESDPDPVMAVDEISEEFFALNRYSIEPFRNVGGTGFVYQRVETGIVSRGVIGTHAYCKLLDTFFFVGSGRNESPSVYLMTSGSSERVATAEIDRLLQSYAEWELAEIVVEAKVDKGHVEALIHLPDRCVVFDAGASKAVGEQVWSTRDSGLLAPAQYRARGHVWCYDRWVVGDPGSPAIGALTETTMRQHGAIIGWDFVTFLPYNEGNDALVIELELVGLPGRVDLGLDPVIWTSYSLNGLSWSQERSIHCGKRGEMLKRMCWGIQGKISNYRFQQFRGTSDARVSIAALQAQFEALQTGRGDG